MTNLTEAEKQAIAGINAQNTLSLPDGTKVPRLGQGTWFMGETPSSARVEAEALRFGFDLGLTLLDTAEMYGSGGAEIVAGQALRGCRDKVFVVSKVYPHNAAFPQLEKSCEDSLKRLGTDRIDLYLLHWRGNIPLEQTVEGMARLIKAGKILRWGVSNFDVGDLNELFSILGSGSDKNGCQCNQVLYHLGSRGIEYDLLSFQEKYGMPIMAYSPLAQAGTHRKGIFENATVKSLAQRHGVEPSRILLAWCLRSGRVIAIPKAVSLSHVIENARANSLKLSPEDLEALDAAFPPPRKKFSLDML